MESLKRKRKEQAEQVSLLKEQCHLTALAGEHLEQAQTNAQLQREQLEGQEATIQRLQQQLGEQDRKHQEQVAGLQTLLEGNYRSTLRHYHRP